SFMVWYSGDKIEQMTFHMRYFGQWGWIFWVMILCNCVIPLLLFSPRIRVNMTILWIISIFVNIGMWFERFDIVAGSLATSFNPSQWHFYTPSITEIMITVGSFAWFLGLFSLFAKFVPIVSMTELKEGIEFLRQAVKKGSSTEA
ncbi:MAG: NrfD/PsrC family molybdoenzyme membrane anchor subunit, partial [Acidobacteriaceae bacterium]